MTRKLKDVGLSIKRVQHHNHREINKRLRVLGISLVQWDTLRHISQQPNASMHDLALLTFQSDQAFGTLAIRMQKQGLIMKNNGRGRVITISLTNKGIEFQHLGNDIVEKVLAETFAPLGESQLKTLDTLLFQILNKL
jgi:DNA-binding MarR family transcriptional regulator